MLLTGAERQASKSANSDTCPHPATHLGTVRLQGFAAAVGGDHRAVAPPARPPARAAVLAREQRRAEHADAGLERRRDAREPLVEVDLAVAVRVERLEHLVHLWDGHALLLDLRPHQRQGLAELLRRYIVMLPLT